MYLARSLSLAARLVFLLSSVGLISLKYSLKYFNNCRGAWQQDKGQNCCFSELSQRIHGPSIFLFPTELTFWDCGSGRGEEPSGENVLRLIQIRLMASSLERFLPACQDKFRRKRESLILAAHAQSVFRLRAQRNAFRRRDVRQQARSFARWNQSLIEIAQVHGCFSSQSFWKAGSVRNGSHSGSSLKSAGVTGIP
jgi:hypothetical protein